MISSLEIQSKLKKILLQVQKPGRYVGGEFNQILKDWHSVDSHIALVFPDIYEIGLPNLGLAILYSEINKRKDALAERVYCPWVDMEKLMRENQIPAYSLESKHSLRDFDIIGISLPYETLYTNALNLLNLAEIPIFSKDRDNSHPFIIAGGNSTFNPEPMAEFFDAFVIGDGEEIIHAVIDTHKNWKNNNHDRSIFLEKLAKHKGIYVPVFYSSDYYEDGRIKLYQRIKPSISFPIYKNLLPKLPQLTSKFIVPNIDMVHNRVAIEIMRGCTRGCRFCQAGIINRPVRERTIEEIIEGIKESLRDTGFEEISLLSLSTSDYTKFPELIDAIKDEFCNANLIISLPSLRIESFSIEAMNSLPKGRHGSFTFAPEAASDHLRNRINKTISSDNLFNVARNVYKHGWSTIKLYFMIGFPDETYDDIESIVSLSHEMIDIGRKALGKKANLHLSINVFIPKPHTPFQWVPLDKQESVIEKQTYLKKNLRIQGIKLNWSDYQSTQLEAWLCRGDRRLSKVIYDAWKGGAKFDAWHDHFQFQTWMDSFARNNLDPAFYIYRNRPYDEIFPWDHIHTGVNKSFLLEEYLLSKEAKPRDDCRMHCYACGIQSNFKVKCITESQN